jgi:hypothetical protein
LLSDTLGEFLWRILLLIRDFTNENRLFTSERFDVSNNNLSGTIPRIVGRLTGLSRLILKRNKLVGSIPSEFGLLKNLRILGLDDNQLSGTVPKELLQLSYLGESIPLVCFPFVALLVCKLFLTTSSIRYAEELALDKNNLNGVIDIGACYLSELKADCGEVECECCTVCCYDNDGCT